MQPFLHDLSQIDERVKSRYNEFFKERDAQKFRLYRNVMAFGVSVIVFGMVVIMISLLMEALQFMIDDNDKNHVPLASLLNIAGTLLRILGLCIYSSVPTKELDIFQELLRPGNERINQFLSFGIGIALLLFSIVFGIKQEPIAFIFAPVGLAFFTNVRAGATCEELAMKMYAAILAFFIFMASTLFQSLVLKSGTSNAPWYLFLGLLYVIGFVIAASFLIRDYLVGRYFSIGSRGWAASTMNAQAYLLCVLTGVFFACQGKILANLSLYLLAVADLLPLLIVLYFGHKRCFGFVARYFELDPAQQQQDGDFMVKLLAASGKDLQDLEAVDEEAQHVDRRRQAYCCCRALLDDDNSSEVESELLIWARDNLRALDWRRFGPQLLLMSPRETEEACKATPGEAAKRHKANFSCSQPHANPRKHSEKIDFFISHTWVDDNVEKCHAIKTFAEDFKRKNGRYPTFWLDAACVDQTDAEACKRSIDAFPIVIGSCKNMLILMSENYLKRLWCLWELFTLFTFCNKELALERIHVRWISNSRRQEALADGHILTPAKTEKEIEEQLKAFEVKQSLLSRPQQQQDAASAASKSPASVPEFVFDQADCYDPGERIRLRGIFLNCGVDRLTESVRELQALVTRVEPSRLRLLWNEVVAFCLCRVSSS